MKVNSFNIFGGVNTSSKDIDKILATVAKRAQLQFLKDIKKGATYVAPLNRIKYQLSF